MANFPPERYNFTSLYILSNGYYIDFKANGSEQTAIIKTPEGGIWQELEPSFSSTSQELVNQAITILSFELGDANLSLTEIIQKQIPPPPKKNIQFNLQGKVLTINGTPITNASVKAFIFEKPQPPPPIPLSAGDNSPQYTNFETSTFEIGAAISMAPVSVDNGGNFLIEYWGENEIDFNQSYIEVTAANYFPKSIGPKLTKTGEKSILKPVSEEKGSFQGSTTVVNEKVIQLNNGNYKAYITLEDPKTKRAVEGIGESLSRETAKKIANNDALSKLALNIPVITPPLDSLPSKENLFIDVYDLGKIILQPEEVDLSKEEVEIKAQIQTQENTIMEQMGKQNLGFEIKMTQLFTKQKENLKQVMLPFILGIIAGFGPTIVNSIVTGKKNALDDSVCPNPDKIKFAIRQRNRLVRDLNRMYKIVSRIAKILKITNALILGLKIGLTIAQTLSSIPITPITPFGLKPFYSGLTESAFKRIDRNLDKAGITVSVLTMLTATIGIVLGAILDLLNKLDSILQSCSEKINPETGEFNVSFVEVNNELNTYVDSATGQTEDIVNPLTGQPFPYKGFTFEIKQDVSQNFQYPKRYAIARNIQGVQVLRSESSFASSPEILIEELKFAIDRDNLRAD